MLRKAASARTPNGTAAMANISHIGLSKSSALKTRHPTAVHPTAAGRDVRRIARTPDGSTRCGAGEHARARSPLVHRARLGGRHHRSNPSRRPGIAVPRRTIPRRFASLHLRAALVGGGPSTLVARGRPPWRVDRRLRLLNLAGCPGRVPAYRLRPAGADSHRCPRVESAGPHSDHAIDRADPAALEATSARRPRGRGA